MAKLLKSTLALCLAALLLFAFAACGNKPEPIEPTTMDEITTTEPETLDVVMTTGEDDTSEEPTTVDAATGEEPSTAPGETTTEAATTLAGKPSTKAEIVAYVNGVMKKVREEKPGYTFQDRTHIDDSNITSSSGFIKTIAPPIIRMAKGAWSNWSDPSVKAKGADHSGVKPKVDFQDSWVKSATCTESGGNYVIRINLIDERVVSLPSDEKTTMHGKVLMAFTKSEIEDGAGTVGVQITKFDCLYTGSYVEMTVDKASGLPKKITAYTAEKVNLEAKLAVTIDASLPLANEGVYTF